MDASGKLSREDHLKLEQFLKSRWKTWACPFDGTTNWIPSDVVVQTMMFVPGGGINIGGGTTYPLVLLLCQNCGYTVFINAIRAGVVEPEPAEKKPKTADDLKEENRSV